MLARVHVRLGAPGLEAASDVFASLGFLLSREADRCVSFNEGDFLEMRRTSSEGLNGILIESDDLDADLRAMREHAGMEALTMIGKQAVQPARAHPNGVVRLERAYIAVEDVAAAAPKYARALGMALPALQRGTVINADMAVFDFPNAGLTLAQPRGPGVAAEALARRGTGLFQVLYRTRSMDAAARWMAEHGVPPPERGVRNTGEQAMLVSPQYGCGVYVGFVGAA